MFIETTIDGKSTIIGVIYRVPIANEEESIRYFEKIIAPIHGKNTDVIIGTFQIFDFLKLNTHAKTHELFDMLFTARLIPCISK